MLLRVLYAFASCMCQGIAASSWLQAHMQNEHRITEYSASSVFQLHDQDASGFLTRSDVLSLYGILNDHKVAEDEKERIWQEVKGIFDVDGDSMISKDEFVQGLEQGHKQLPDYGYPGHHGDMEYEYELHHWSIYHADDEDDSKLTHPEDIEHEKEHQAMFHRPPVDPTKNIPAKYRRH